MLSLFEASWRDLWDGREHQESLGAVFTRPEIVDLILDLAGYAVRDGHRLSEVRVLEPSCGDGAFTARIIERLIASEEHERGRVQWGDAAFDTALRAADISLPSVEATRAAIVAQLTHAGCPGERAASLADAWTVQTDFLLHQWDHPFDLVVGNPPYVRIEDVPRRVLECYRALYETTTDRADLYVAFFEQGLHLLSEHGTLAYICANRFVKNKYGQGLRRLIADQYHVRYYLNLEHTQPFTQDVSAYPAIVIVDRHRGQPTRAGTIDDIDAETLELVRKDALGKRRPSRVLAEFVTWYPTGSAWLTTCDEEHGLLSGLNTSLPTLEDSAPGTKVGIGVATGADRVFVLQEKHEAIEESRQIPLLMAFDISNQKIDWSGRYLVNPFDEKDDGSLVALTQYPGLARYLDAHAKPLRGRHVAQSRPHAWYRTIDRIWPTLQKRPKLVIPDIQGGTSTIGFDDGRYYPHHNVYWITSDSWPLRALKTLLRSSTVLQQVRAYSVQMRGGSLRYQAQTLRKIRVPSLHSLPSSLVARLEAVAESERQEDIDHVAEEAFTLALRSAGDNGSSVPVVREPALPDSDGDDPPRLPGW